MRITKSGASLPIENIHLSLLESVSAPITHSEAPRIYIKDSIECSPSGISSERIPESHIKDIFKKCRVRDTHRALLHFLLLGGKSHDQDVLPACRLLLLLLELLLRLLQSRYIIGWDGEAGKKRKRERERERAQEREREKKIRPNLVIQCAKMQRPFCHQKKKRCQEKWSSCCIRLLLCKCRCTYNTALHISPPGPGHMPRAVSI